MATEFQEKVYSLCRKIPKGKVSTYGEIARALGKSGVMSRAVGNALNKNPYCAWGLFCCRQDSIVPCHRVVKSDGSIGGFASGSEKKIRLLKQEGVEVKNSRIVDFKKILFSY